MGALVLACGNAETTDLFTERDVVVHAVPSRPGKADVDALLGDAEHVVVVGTDADLAAVVLRLMRTERLGSVRVGFVPVGASAVADLWDLPGDARGAVRVALDGDADQVPLIRDDAGGVLVGLGRLKNVRGVAYCDDTTALRGRAGRIDVTADPEGGAGLIVRVARFGFLGRKVQSFAGRAFQVGCLPVIPELNGVAHPRDVQRWTWYRHTEDLRLMRGL